MAQLATTTIYGDLIVQKDIYLSGVFIGGLTLQSSSYTIRIPSDSTSWIGGVTFYTSDGATLIGGFGLSKSPSAVQHLYMAHGSNPASSGYGIYVVPSGNVGIGTTNPAYKLDVAGDIRFTGTLQGGTVPWARLSGVPAASTSQAGIVQLNNTVTSTSTTQAATANAVKQAYDLAASKVSKAGDTMTGKLTAPSYGSVDTRDTPTSPGDYKSEMRLQFKRLSSIGLNGIASGTYCQLVGYRAWNDDSGGRSHEVAFTDGGDIYYRNGTQASGWGPWQKMWHAGNDGSGSGLDADLLDGQDSSYYRNASNLNAGNLNIARMPTGGTWNLSSNLAINGANVGIGTTSPAQRLHVMGNIRVGNGSQNMPIRYVSSDSTVSYRVVLPVGSNKYATS